MLKKGGKRWQKLAFCWLWSSRTTSFSVRWHLFLHSYRCHMAQVKLTDRNTETFLTQSPSITNLILKMSLAGRRERYERLLLKVNNIQEIYEKALLACLHLEKLFNSLPFFFSLEIFKCNRERTEWVLVQNEQCVYSNAFSVQLYKNHPKSPLSSDFNDGCYFPKTLNDNSSVSLLIKSFVSDNQNIALQACAREMWINQILASVWCSQNEKKKKKEKETQPPRILLRENNR